MSARRSFSAGLRRGLLSVLLISQLAVPCFGIAFSAQSQPISAAQPKSASIRTPDFDESVRWYQDKLGFRLISTQSLVPGRVAVLERNGFLMEIAEADHVLPQPQDPSDTGGVQVTRHPVISLLVSDVDAEVTSLEAKGVEILQAPEDTLDGSYRVAQIRDNGRHRIELREPLGAPGSFHPAGR